MRTEKVELKGNKSRSCVFSYTFVQLPLIPTKLPQHLPVTNPAHELFLVYLVLPNEKGTYRYLIICWICLRTGHIISTFRILNSGGPYWSM